VTDSPVTMIIAPLSTHERSGWWHPNLGKFVSDLPHMVGYATSVCPMHNFTPAASARNILCKKVLELEEYPDWICMIDNDMDPPYNLLDTVKDAPADAGIVVPEFSMFNQTEKKLTLCWSPDIPEYDGHPIKLDIGFHRLVKCGTGAIFIKPEAFRNIAYPYFTYVYNEDGMQTGTEDIAFCEKAIKAGVKIYGNNRIRVGHYKSVDLGVLSQMLNRLDRTAGTSIDSMSKAECPSAAAR